MKLETHSIPPFVGFVVIAIVVLFALSSCSTVGPAIVGKAAIAIGEKIGDRVAWDSRHQEMGVAILNMYRDMAAQERATGDLDAAIEAMRKAMEFHLTLRPKFVVEKVLEKAKEE